MKQATTEMSNKEVEDNDERMRRTDEQQPLFIRSNKNVVENSLQMLNNNKNGKMKLLGNVEREDITNDSSFISVNDKVIDEFFFCVLQMII